MSSPVVSIIVPCYNQAHYLPEALQSVLDQSYQDWECIIVDDGSPDNTAEVAAQWAQRDSRFSLHRIENGGLSNARNQGINVASGKFILPLDADDKIAGHYLEQAMEIFKNMPSVKVVYGAARYFGARDSIWELRDFDLKNLATKNLIYCSALYRKEDWEDVGGYDVNMKHGFEDWEFWISLLKNGGEVYKIDTVCFYYRISEGSMLGSMTDTHQKELFDYMSAKHPDFYIRHLGNFQQLARERYEAQVRSASLLKSNKQAINTLCKNLFGFRPFKHMDNG